MLEKSHSETSHVHLTSKETQLGAHPSGQKASSFLGPESDSMASKLEQLASSDRMEAVRAAWGECLASEA